jgi:lipopolysaccharide transport system permease protein
MTPISPSPRDKSRPTNPHAAHPVSINAMLRSLWFNRQVLLQMIKRDVVGRYKGSTLGLVWSFLTPLFMLLVYTFVFSVVFNARWGVTEQETKAQFALVLFVGLIVNSLFAEVLNRAPGLILGSANYVKKVVFPLEILPVISIGTALFHSLASLLVFLIGFLAVNGFLHWTTVFIPFVLLPLTIFTLGVSWVLASLGVFVRDIAQTVVIATTAIMFLAPVFYPLAAVPRQFRTVIMSNPLTLIIEQARQVLIWGHAPDWAALSVYTVIALASAWAGYIWFQRTRKGFADVL